MTRQRNVQMPPKRHLHAHVHLAILALVWVLATPLSLRAQDTTNLATNLATTLATTLAVYRQIAAQLSDERREEIKEHLRENGDFVHHEPVLLSQLEIDLLRRGAQQRARAINAFLRDLFSDGARRAFAAGVVDSKAVGAVLKETGLDRLHGYVDSDRINYIYGPDIVRRADGNFVPLEDNMTLTSGLDIEGRIAKMIYGLTPEMHEFVAKPSRDEFFSEMMRLYRAEADRIAPGSEIVLLRYATPKWITSKIKILESYDQHWRMVARRLQPYGVKVIEALPIIRSNGAKSSRLSISDNDVTLETISEDGARARSRVGFVLLATQNRDLHGWLAPGLLNVFRRGQIALSHTPGAELFDSKILYPYVDGMIRFYLDEEPLLRGLQTRTFTQPETGNLDSEFFTQVFANIDTWVIKDNSSTSAGGRGVFIGPVQGHDSAALSDLKARVKKNPGGFNAQEYAHPALHLGWNVDFRPLTVVVGDEMFTTQHPISRMAPPASGKTNYSADPNGVKMGGVLTRKEPRSRCEDLWATQKPEEPSR